MPERIAVVTGGNRGIGLEVCRRLAREGVTVVLTARDEGRGRSACDALKGEDLPVLFHPLDVTDEAGARRLAGFIEREFGGLDILVNNAGVRLDSDGGALDMEVETVRRTMETNVYGPWRLSRAMVPLMRKRGSGRIVNVSSEMGMLSRLGGEWPAYRISKTALDALTLILADELKGTGILVNAVYPGWTRTDMGGRSAPRSVEEGADTAVWLALLPDGGPTGKVFKDRKVIAG